MPKTPKLRVPIVPVPPTEEPWVYGCHFTVSELERAHVVLTGK